jgi:hypothetical protein
MPTPAPPPVAGVDGGPDPFDEDGAFACQDVPEDVYVGVLEDVTKALDATDMPWGLLGGVASAIYGRPRWTHDIDVLVRPKDARGALDALAGAGFLTDEKDEHWLYKGIRDGVLVDVLFKAKGDVYLDEEMVVRLERRTFLGLDVPVIPPEDLLVIKAVVHHEETPRHWHDALGIIAGTELDWDYLVERARRGPRRVLSLLLYAQSVDLVVPDRAINALIAFLDLGPETDPGRGGR